MINSSDFINTGNLSPMSPTPVGDISCVSAGSTSTGISIMLPDPVDRNRTFPANGRSSAPHMNDDVCLNHSVNILPQPRLVNNRPHLQQKNGVFSMDTGSRMMPLNTALHCGVDYANLDPTNASRPKDDLVNGSVNGHIYYEKNGQIVDAMGTSSTMQWLGNDRHLHASQYSEVPVSAKHPNHTHQQHSIQSHIANKGTFYNSTSSDGPGDVTNFSSKSIGWHSSRSPHSQQQYEYQNCFFSKQQSLMQPYLQPQLQPYQQREQKYDPQQHQQRHKFWQQQNRHPYLEYQHLQNHKQQTLPIDNGLKHSHAASNFLWRKQTGSDLPSQKLICQEHSNELPLQTKQTQPHSKSPSLKESQQWQLDQRSHSQNVQQLQALSPQDQLQIQTQNDAVGFPSGFQTKSAFQGQGKSKPQERIIFLDEVDCLEKKKQVDKHVQRTEQQNSHQLSWTQKESADQPISTVNVEKIDRSATRDADVSGQFGDVTEKQPNGHVDQKEGHFCHASKCLVAEKECQTLHCSKSKQLPAQMIKCQTSHQQDSCDCCCPVSAPGCQISEQKCNRTLSPHVTYDHFNNKSNFQGQTKNVMHEGRIQEPPMKKLKTAPTSLSEVQKHVEAGQKFVPSPKRTQLLFESQCHAAQENDSTLVLGEAGTFNTQKQEAIPVKTDLRLSLQQNVLEKCGKLKKDGESKDGQEQQVCSQSVSETTTVALSKGPFLTKQEENQAKLKAPRMTPNSDSLLSIKVGKPRLKGISLMEFFTPEQIRDHIAGLQKLNCQAKENAEYNQYARHRVPEKTCQLCMVGNLKFQPPPIYCTSCGTRIKCIATYYAAGAGVTRNLFCMSCYNAIKDDAIGLDGMTYLKSNLEKRKNDEENEEGWVQCCKCDLWQHQICALFNSRRIENGHVDYICPNCYITEIEGGERKPLPQSAVLGAKDLPKTCLSDHIEERLSRRLKEERKERAASLGKSYDEVPGAEALIVRVVSSVDKKVEVKQNFLEIVQDEDYPSELPYRSKVLLLFQKIGGMDVFLFSMYVQEFGSECSHPNQRRISLSYLDSVKYFRPDVKTVTGESLRTFVYHEILIGYLDYCKRRGFTSCYIWACPPLKGEDYILYCHPKIQKTPKCDKLREWYLKMLSKATQENIVLEITNFYDYFFTSKNECKAKVTVTRLPYFDGDYWPGAIEDTILQLQLKDENFRKQHKKSKTKRSTVNWISNAAPHSGSGGSLSKDVVLMQKLKEPAYAMKDDFIMVHMHQTCTHCRLFILSGRRWVCNQCGSFQICDKCFEAEEHLNGWDRHPINSKEKHILSPIEVTDIPSNTEDKDEIMESEFFDTRQSFLSLCQGNHYQYDTLRRAKHSSMMILYHLHNPAAPAFASTCNVCERDIETGQGWRCETCVDFDICNACYNNDKFMGHPHKLTAHPSIAEYNAQNRDARQKRVVQLRKMLDLMVHASRCSSPQCEYPNCRKVKGLFRHGTQCKMRASKGCAHCKKMWYLIQLHGRACKESKCRVPHCKDLKEHFRRLQQQMESRRRAAVTEMMRQRTADASSKCS